MPLAQRLLKPGDGGPARVRTVMDLVRSKQFIPQVYHARTIVYLACAARCHSWVRAEIDVPSGTFSITMPAEVADIWL